nr:MAG TPA: major capsid protein [Caudoviricetes sp.]
MSTASVFDKKIFNGEVFKGYVDRIPNPNKTELIKSRAIRPRPDLATAMADQDGGNYLTTTLKGLINNTTPQNYDGSTDITAGSTATFRHSRVVVGRANAWTENDFSYDITGGQDFIENIAEQIAEYWNEIDQSTIVHILKGVFSMTDAEGAKFVAAHTTDVTGNAAANDVGAGCMSGTTLNTAIQKACGDAKGKFSMAIMHSVVATNLENLKLLAYMKYTDGNGIERDLSLATLNGRVVLVDDTMPADEIPATYKQSTDTSPVAGKTYYTKGAGDVYTPVANPTGTQVANYEVATPAKTVYTTFVLGDGAIEYTDCGAKVPYETDRNPSKNGGQDTLYSRQRKCFAPFGISFTMASMAKLSPTDAELEKGANWELVNSTTETGKEYIAHKTIPIAQIKSLG